MDVMHKNLINIASCMQALSASVYPDGTVATPEGLFLGAERDDEGVLVSATTTLWVRTNL